VLIIEIQPITGGSLNQDRFEPVHVFFLPIDRRLGFQHSSPGTILGEGQALRWKRDRKGYEVRREAVAFPWFNKALA
jgi:hypothetical protein